MALYWRHHARSPKLRSAIKAVTWRVVASADTFLIGYLVTGNFVAGASIEGFEVLTKMFVYYFHERVWAHLKGE